MHLFLKGGTPKTPWKRLALETSSGLEQEGTNDSQAQAQEARRTDARSARLLLITDCAYVCVQPNLEGIFYLHRQQE
jgi:hypothetical protein